MANKKVKVVLVQLGSPKSPAVSDVRSFLKEFLGDPRVVDINPIVWKLILNLFVIPFRPARSAKLYSRIWDGESFPLITNTRDFALEVQKNLEQDDVEVNHAFLLCEPRVSDIWDSWEKDVKENNKPATELIVIPMFPQYSESTIASGADAFSAELKTRVMIPPFRFITNFHKTKAFIDNSVRQINGHVAAKKMDDLIISFHGIPKRRVIYKDDAYFQHCFETFYLLREGIKGIERDKIHMTFQSRFGSEEWLTPYTDEYAVDLVEKGSKVIGVYCPSFVADCLETTDEIGTELQEELEQVGGEVAFIPCLNDDESWARDFSKWVHTLCQGTKSELMELEYEMPKEAALEMPEQKMKSPPLSPKAKKSIKIIFLTLFLDLIGFSIIFPLFPALAKHYLSVDGDNFFLKMIFGSIDALTRTGGVDNFNSIVLFGGALGAIYSLLQFIAAPIWGGISDRIGRKPVLMISIFGLAISYLLWIVSGSFTVLILARLIGGIMGGNISAATAVVADVTTKENRSKGMAFIGIAFAFGFIIGPAMGGLLSLIDLTKVYPSLISYGINPFSMPAVVAFVLACYNLYSLSKNFEETLPESKRGKSVNDRSNNPFKLFKPLPFKGVNGANIGHFFFLMAFSGMEFTLTFLAVERLAYTPMDNAYMFIFIGFVIAFVQGGVVRRKASQVGEKKMALWGLISIIPGLISIAYAQSSFLIYVGLFFLAVGSSMAIPCLTSLVSIYTPGEKQGQSIGIFRSLGALARVIGPIAASLIYWKMGTAQPYLLGAVFLLIPIVIVAKLPDPKSRA